MYSSVVFGRHLPNTIQNSDLEISSGFKNVPESTDINYRNCYCNKETHTDILRRLRDAARRKRLEEWRTNRWFLPHDNAPAHRSILIKDFLENNKVTTLGHPPHSPDLDQTDFYLLPRMKSH
jgi:hypothetical protein